jgi:hypothetical protein
MITVVISLYTQKRDEPSRKSQMTMRFTGHYKTGDPQNGTVFPSPFWRPEFGREYNRIVFGSSPSGPDAPRPYDRPYELHTLY